MLHWYAVKIKLEILFLCYFFQHITMMELEIANDVTVKIKYFIDAGMKKQISWTTLVTILGEMASTIDASKEVIKILLDVLFSKLEKDGKEASKHHPNSETNKHQYSEDPSTQNSNFDVIDETDEDDDTVVNIDIADMKEELSNEELPSEELSIESFNVLEENKQSNKGKSSDSETIASTPPQENDINEFNLDTSNNDNEPKRVKLECFICMKTFRYRIELLKHMKTHVVQDDSEKAVQPKQKLKSQKDDQPKGKISIVCCNVSVSKIVLYHLYHFVSGKKNSFYQKH